MLKRTMQIWCVCLLVAKMIWLTLNQKKIGDNKMKKAKQTDTPETESPRYTLPHLISPNPLSSLSAGGWGASITFERDGTMEAPPSANYVDTGSEVLHFSSSSFDDPDLIEITSSEAWASSHSKRKRNRVVIRDVIEIDDDDDSNAVLDTYKNKSDHKNKQPIEEEKAWKKNTKEALTNDFGGSSHDTVLGTQLDTLNAYVPGTIDLNHSGEPDISIYDYDSSENYDQDFEYDVDLMENEFDFNLAAKFDDLDLPPGVEAPVPWLQRSEYGSSSKSKPKIVLQDAIEVKYKAFKQFDTVQDHFDHHFSKPGLVKGCSAVIKPLKDWAKRIQHEWKVLEKDLPESIFVRVYEDRMDILRAAIIGPAETPYHDGLYFFDVFFPPSYPQMPPMVHYHSGGLRLNPNLYACGKVCLSLLNTWGGSGCEKWNPSNSTMLQVLVSIQALVLNAKPYFNEPGFANSANTPMGENKSLAYNQNAFLLSCKTMLYTLRRPPRHFEDYVAGHFRNHGRSILLACNAYLAGAQVGCLVGEGVQDVDQGGVNICSTTFKSTLKKLFEDLLMEFTVKGADCDSILAQKVKDAAYIAQTELKL